MDGIMSIVHINTAAIPFLRLQFIFIIPFPYLHKSIIVGYGELPFVVEYLLKKIDRFIHVLLYC